MKHKLDYSSLTEPVTKADIAAYKQSGLHSGPKIMNIVIAVVLVALGLSIALLAVDTLRTVGLSQAAFMPIIVIGIFIVFLWQMLRGSTKRRAKLYKFALRNNLTYLVDAGNPGYAGMIFDNGHSREVEDALRFGDGTEIGNYTYVTGSGKNRTTHTWAYVKVKLARRLPNMVLDARGNNFWKFSNLSDSFDRSQTLALEGDFNNYFTLYAPKQYERDALYVFTPDVMAAMVDYGKEYDIEIVDDELFIYGGKHFKLDRPEFYKNIVAIIDTIKGELLDQTDYYADERVGDHTANIIAPQGRRLKTGFSWIIVAFILIIIFFSYILPLVQRLILGSMLPF